jgi:hypothetical protein
MRNPEAEIRKKSLLRKSVITSPFSLPSKALS